jgi:hypothetical protein
MTTRTAASASSPAQTVAERIGQSNLLGHSLLGLARIALRQHDTDAVRAWTSRALAAADGIARGEYMAGAKACLAWLAWQDGHPEDVIKLASEIAELQQMAFGAGSHESWVYLWPLLAAHLDAGQMADAIATARTLADTSRQRLPDALESAVECAVAAWEQNSPERAKRNLVAALALAKDLRFI